MTAHERRPRLVISFDEDPVTAEPAREQLPVAAAAGPPVDLPQVALRPAAPPPERDWAPPEPAAAPLRDWPAPSAPPRALAAEDRVLASWGRRAAALLIDGVIVWLLAIPIIAVFFLFAGSSIGGLIAAYLAASVLPSVVALIYYPALLGRHGDRNGQTYGKQALGLRVVSTSATGPEVTTGQAVLRDVVMRQLLFAGLGALLLWIPLLLDCLWPLWDQDRRALHDMAASTIVVRDER